MERLSSPDEPRRLLLRRSDGRSDLLIASMLTPFSVEVCGHRWRSRHQELEASPGKMLRFAKRAKYLLHEQVR